MFLYSPVSSPLDRSKSFTLFVGRPVHSDTNTAFSGSILATLQLRAKTTSLTFPPFYIKGKGMVLYSAVSSPLDRSKRFTLSSPGRPVHSDTVLGFSWKHSSHAAIAQRLFTHISTTVYNRYSFRQLTELARQWRKRK